MDIQNGLSLPSSVYGRFVDVCYDSINLGKIINLGQVYFPNIPNHIFPSNGASLKDDLGTITFKLLGGDQSYGDAITLVNFENDISETSQDSILVYESSPTYQSYTMTLSKQNIGDVYTSININDIDASNYILAWKPSYLTYRTTGGMNEYKNLFTTWTVQSPPKVKFPEIQGLINVVDNGGLFKSGLMYLNLTGPGQNDGDQLIFCFSSCNYGNIKGSIYTRRSGKYPAIWFGEEYGVHNLLDDPTNNQLYICWRSSAKMSIPAADDQWSTTYQEINGDLMKAFIRVNLIQENENLAEIAEINPPLSNPVLLSGESIWFKISKCDTLKMKPSSFNNIPGRIQVIHVKYNTTNHLQYETEVIWEQIFTQMPDNTNSGFTIGDLQGDPLSCVYTITNLPTNLMLPGHSYQLIIYSRSFKSGFTGDYLFGNLDPSLQQFIYWFDYQEVDFQVTTQNYIPTQTQIEIQGNNFGEVAIEGAGFTEFHRLFSVSLNLKCNDIYIPASYMIRNLKQGSINSLVLTDLNLQSCNSSLNIEILLRKINDNDDYPVWSVSNTNSQIELGNVGCDPTCLTCNGTKADNCLSCYSNGKNIYLYKGQCLEECGKDLPYAQIIFSDSQAEISYYYCVSSCYPGYYLESKLNICMKCNDECRTCASGYPNSCLTCPNTPIQVLGSLGNDNNIYTQLYFFKGMCMLSCPVVSFNSTENYIITDNNTHQCSERVFPSGLHPISVALQPLALSERIDIKATLQLRALVNDSTQNLTSITWSAIPPENINNASFITSAERVFLSYSPTYINNTIAYINTNAFNYRGQYTPIRIMIKAATCDSLAYTIFELFGNRPPDITGNITFSQNSSFNTLSSLDINLSGVQDSEDFFQILTFKVILQPRSLIIPPNVSSLTATPLSALEILSTLPTTTILLSDARVLTPKNGTIIMNNILIPALLNGPQVLSGLSLNKLMCDLVIYCEDRFFALSTIKQSVNITETYSPANRSSLLSFLYNSTLKNNMSWGMALNIAQCFKIANPTPPIFYMSLQLCSRDNQCGINGKCITSAGWSECKCNAGYAGMFCNWTVNDLTNARSLSKAVLLYLNDTVLSPINYQLKANNSYSTEDINIVYQIATVLNGLLQNPEVVEPLYVNIVQQLGIVITSINAAAGERLINFQKTVVISAIDSVMQSLFFIYRPYMYSFYTLSEAATGLSSNFSGEFAESRKKDSRVNIANTFRTL